MTQRGFLIVVEGLDRSGKTTQCTHLTSRLRSLGYKVRYQKFPDRSTPTGQIINAYLTGQQSGREEETPSDHAMHLIFSANRWEAVRSIVADLKRGITVVVDRYSFSGAVYSTAKGREDLDLNWAWAPEIGLPSPDLVVFLDISEDKARERGGYGEERYEKEEMQRKVRELFRLLWKRLEPQKLDVRVLDAGLQIHEVADSMWKCFEDMESTLDASDLGALQSL